MKKAKVVFMGTPDFAVPILNKLIELTDVVLVVTQPDKLSGRKKELTKSPVKKIAEENNIEVFQPIKIREDYKRIKEVNPDLIVTCAYGQILPLEVLMIPKIDSFNVHASILPSYRGASPIQSALLNGDEKTGVTVMYMDKGMDTGDMVGIIEYKIKDTDNFESLHDELSNLGAKLLEKVLPSIIDGTNFRLSQNDSKATYTKKITREDERINFNMSGKDIINKIRAFDPYPLANILIDEKEVKIIKATFEESKVEKVGIIKNVTKDTIDITCKDGIIKISKIKPFGKKEMLVKDYLNGIDNEVLKNAKINS